MNNPKQQLKKYIETCIENDEEIQFECGNYKIKIEPINRSWIIAVFSIQKLDNINYNGIIFENKTLYNEILFDRFFDQIKDKSWANGTISRFGYFYKNNKISNFVINFIQYLKLLVFE